MSNQAMEYQRAMSTTCPNGHLSTTTDYCDECGTRLADIPVPAAASPEPSSDDASDAPHPTAPSLPSEPCPDCRVPRVGSDKFCEGCGYDFTTGTSSGHPASSSDPSQSPPPTAALWEAVVSADREYLERVAAEEVDFPSHCPSRKFMLDQPEINIGRRSPSRSITPEIDLSGAPQDPAISHLHAILLRQDDRSYALIDPGSINGTTLNDDPAPIAPNTPVPLADGDRIHLGAWTTITLRRVSADASEA
jgi:FHA domain